jgi:BON domain
MSSEDERGRNQHGWRGRDHDDWDDRRTGHPYGGEGTYGGMARGEHQGNTFGREPYGGQPGNQRSYGGFGYQGNQGFSHGSRGYFDEGRSRRDYEPGTQGWSEPWRGRADPWQSRSDERDPRGMYTSGTYTGAQESGQRWDEPQRGNYVGKGPRGYRRSDQRVQEDVSDALTRDPHVDASEVEVRVSNGEVTLVGTVADRHQKRTAESCVERVEGVTDVHNQIRVGPEGAPGIDGGPKEVTTQGRSAKT